MTVIGIKMAWILQNQTIYTIKKSMKMIRPVYHSDLPIAAALGLGLCVGVLVDKNANEVEPVTNIFLHCFISALKMQE